MARILGRGSSTVGLSVFVGILCLVGWQAYQRKGSRDFRVEARQVLQIMTGGDRLAIEKLYRESSPVFRERHLLEDVTQYAAYITKELGTFKKILAISDSEMHSGPLGRTGFIEAQMKHTKRTRKGALSFHQIDGRWRLLHISVDLPKQVVQLERKPVPDTIVDLTRRLFVQLRNKKHAAIYDQASEYFQQAKSKKDFLRMLRDQYQVLGGAKSIVEITGTQMSADQRQGTVFAKVAYARENTTATVKWRKSELDRGNPSDDNWQLIGFTVAIPNRQR